MFFTTNANESQAKLIQTIKTIIMNNIIFYVVSSGFPIASYYNKTFRNHFLKTVFDVIWLVKRTFGKFESYLIKSDKYFVCCS